MTPLDFALAYAALGWRVVPIPPGYKYPKGVDDWPAKATTDTARIRRYWGKHPDHGIGIATGPGSGVVAIDIDSYAGGDDEWKALEAEHGVAPETVEAITGGGGRHLAFANPAGVVIVNSDNLPPGIDVRGEGGQIVVAPTIHPKSGRAYQWEVEHDPLAGFRPAEMPEWLVKILTQPPVVQQARRERSDYTGNDSIVDRFNASVTWPELLERDGWTFTCKRCVFATGELYELWTRPGKPVREGASASLYYKGSDVLKVFTSSAHPLVASETYTKFGYEATMRHNGDMRAMGSDARHRLGGSTRHTQLPAPEQSDDSAAHLPMSFWDARPVFAHIRQAAHSRARSADAYLGAILARIAAITHPSIRLPAIVAAPAPLTLYVAQVGRSGLGKSSTVSGAMELLPYEGDQVADNMPLGSGEGLIELFYDLVDEEGTDGKTRKVKRQTRHGAFIYLDEGQALAELGGRKGSTLLPMLRTAWSGVVLGTSNASVETKRRLAAGSYAIGLVIAFQPTKAAELLADTAGGTPQRFEWMQGIDPTLPDILPPWPGPLSWVHPTLTGYTSSIFPTLMEVPESIAAPIRRKAITLTRGEIQPDELDSHLTLARLKVAGLLAVLDSRTNITDEDWELAGVFQRTSHHVRATVLATVAIEQRNVEAASIARHVSREGAVIDNQVERAVWRMAKAIGRHVHRATHEEGCTIRCITQSTASRDRALATITDAIERAIEFKWVKVDIDTYRRGEARPK